MEERVELSILLDFYGVLLTEKQFKIMNLYYNDDLSLAEISELANTSRQAVYDIIKRCHKLLLQYELKLELFKKYKETLNKKKNLVKKIDNAIENADKVSVIMLNEIRNYIIDNI